MAKLWLTYAWKDNQDQDVDHVIEKLKEAGVPNNYIIKKGAAHDQSAMMPELKQFTDWFDKYLK